MDHKQGDIYEVEGKEYSLRYIGVANGWYWLEPVIANWGSHFVAGGLNKIYMIDDLNKLKKLATRGE